MAFNVSYGPSAVAYGSSLANAAAQGAARADYYQAIQNQLQHNQMLASLMSGWMQMKQQSDAAKWNYMAHVRGTPAERAALSESAMRVLGARQRQQQIAQKRGRNVRGVGGSVARL